LPAFLEWIAAKLDVSVKSYTLAELKWLRAFTLDLSRFRLRLSERTPCLELTDESLRQWTPAQLKRLLDDIVRIQKWQQRNILVLANGSADDLKLLCWHDSRPPIVLDAAAQARIMSGGMNSNLLIEEISKQTRISALAPYEVSRPVTGEQFFGREGDLRHILQSDNTSFLIVGNRRMGKTSLMREALRRMRRASKNDDALQYFDCSVFTSKLELFGEIVRALSPREVERVYHDSTFSMTSFLQRMSKAYKEKIVLFLDEVDRLMEWDARDNWTALNTFRAVTAMTHGHHEEQPLRVLMAGFREAQEWSRNRETPLLNFITLLRVKPFDHRDTEQLVVEPMLNLGITIVDRSAVVNRIYRETGGHPNLIQHYCQFIIRYLEDIDSRVLNQEVLDAAPKDDTIRHRTADELIANATNLEQLIVFCFIQYAWHKGVTDRFTLADADGWLHQHGVHLLRDDLEKALGALETSGVMARDGRFFSFSFAALPRALNESRDPRYQIKKIIEEGV
jgi:hypothetical protein